MGLDMYLTGDEYIPTYDAAVKREVRNGFEVESYRLKMGYWRKFGPLHAFMVKRFADGVDNCAPISLDASNLREVASALRANALPDNDESHGFFFGNPEIWDEDRADAERHAEVFDRAAEWVEADGWRSVFYQASW